MHWLSALGERGPHILPVCSLHDCPTFQTPRDDPGNENGMSTCNSGIGQVDQMAGSLGNGEQPPSYSSGPPSVLEVNGSNSPTCTPGYLSLRLPGSATGENPETRHLFHPIPWPEGSPGNHSPSLCSLVSGKMWPAGVPPAPAFHPRPQGHPGTLCSPRQSNMAISWWRLDSDEFNRSWILSRSF